MHIVEGMTVDFLHYVGSRPPARTKDISVRDVLRVEITGEEMAERVERVWLFDSKLFLLGDKTLCDDVRM